MMLRKRSDAAFRPTHEQAGSHAQSPRHRPELGERGRQETALHLAHVGRVNPTVMRQLLLGQTRVSSSGAKLTSERTCEWVSGPGHGAEDGCAGVPGP
jgi:hypothetical protein